MTSIQYKIRRIWNGDDGEMYEVEPVGGNAHHLWYTAHRKTPADAFYILSNGGRQVKPTGQMGRKISRAIAAHLEAKK